MSIALVTATLLAHVAPSPTENNRYAKVELRPAAVRIVYTLYFGERPGAGERRQMDANRDGTVDEEETAAYAALLLAEAGPRLAVELDGRPRPAPWTVADVGLGTPAASGGAFSVDLALEARLTPTPAGEHTLWLEDLWVIPFPGETEIRVEAAPGVTLLASHPRRDGQGVLADVRYRGLAKPGEQGMWIRFRVDAAPPPEAAAPAPRPRRRWMAVVAAAVAAVLVVGLWWARKKASSGR